MTLTLDGLTIFVHTHAHDIAFINHMLIDSHNHLNSLINSSRLIFTFVPNWGLIFLLFSVLSIFKCRLSANNVLIWITASIELQHGKTPWNSQPLSLFAQDDSIGLLFLGFVSRREWMNDTVIVSRWLIVTTPNTIDSYRNRFLPVWKLCMRKLICAKKLYDLMCVSAYTHTHTHRIRKLPVSKCHVQWGEIMRCAML